MNLENAEQIANAILYEGYLLYPYRTSSIKNRQRWNFGVVYPRFYSEKGGGIEPWTMQTECLVSGQPEAQVDVTVRFLHLLERTAAPAGAGTAPTLPAGWPPGPLESGAGSSETISREEGMERRITGPNIRLGDLISSPTRLEIEFPGWETTESLPGPPADVAIHRRQKLIMGAVLISAEKVAGTRTESDLYRLRVLIENTTPESNGLAGNHEAALLQSFISTHTIIQAHQAEFISLLEPPEALQEAAQGCRNLNTWPVLLGNTGDFDAILSSPIILYDYPQIAPESAGPLFDGTEIDEILTLRILTLTDAEKEELRRGDRLGRELLERIEALSPEQLMKLHGVIRNLG